MGSPDAPSEHALLGEVGEFGLIQLLASWMGDLDVHADAALVRAGSETLALTTDALVEGVHFRSGWSKPSDVGFKAVSVNVSDLAATGARPRWALVVLGAPPDTPLAAIHDLYRGIKEACATYGLALVGGDTVRASSLVVALTAVGVVEGRPLRRAGALPGDRVAVTGPLGRAAAGLNLLLARDTSGAPPHDALRCLEAHRRPRARLEAGLELAAWAHAAIDVSDGLASDARRLAEASAVGIELHQVPVAAEARRVAEARGWDAEQMALGGGEDLELLVAVPADRADELLVVGRVVDEPGVWMVREGERRPLEARGFDHFRSLPS